MPRASSQTTKKSTSSATKPRTTPKKKTGQSSSVAVAAAAAATAAGLNHIDKKSKKVDQFFYTYANKSSGEIDPVGVEKLCSDIQVEHTDVKLLMLAWKMQCENQGYFTLEEWQRYLNPLHISTAAQLKKALPQLEQEVMGSSNFEDFYRYAFRYCLTEDQQKVLEIDTVCQLLHLVLGSMFSAQVDYLTEFLKEQTVYKVITMDQWRGFYRFCKEISFPDMGMYDADLAWPLILDNFVAWMKAKQN